ncbi:MAG: RNase adapter RapZ [Clostridiales bacterium]|nr:RNase adapter RapZ [Clostridiales bacterium]
MRFIIVTGLSGAGKTLASHYLEDMGFFCIDNLPPKLMPKFAELCYQSEGKIDQVAVVVDIRGGGFFDDLFDCLDIMQESGYPYEILYLDASDDVLVRRYKESRRIHPMMKEGRVIEGIQLERERLKKLRQKSTNIIDTSNLQPKQLKEIIGELVSDNESSQKKLIISVISFGFKYGMLMDGDMIFDVRFLANPFYIEELKEHTGKEPVIKEYLSMFPETQTFLNKLEDMLEFLIPNYIKEGKNQLVIGIGCTGGVHRSVTIADAIANKLKEHGHHVTQEHRDIHKKR